MSKNAPFSNELGSCDDIAMDSMLTLNNQCLWKIFKMFDIKTLCRVPDVCNGFRDIAEAVFRLYHAEVKLLVVSFVRNLTKYDFLKFVQLKKLKYFKIDFDRQYGEAYSQFIYSLLESFVINKIPIVETSLNGLAVSSMDIPLICKFKTISKLSVYGRTLV